jgi:amino acid transporter
MTTSAKNTETVAESPTTGRAGKLGTASIVFMVAAAASPLSILAGVIPLGFLLGNGIGVPVMFAVAGAVFLLFSVGLVSMAARVEQPGGFFALIVQGAGRVPGVAASFVALAAYWAMAVGIAGYLGYVVEVTLAASFGVDLPWWLYSLAALVVAGALGYQRIDTSSRVLSVLLLAELLVVVVMTIAVVATGGAEGLSLRPFAPAEIFSGSPAIGLVFAASAFVGFEATVIYRREARNPAKTIPRATYLAVITVGVFYVVSAWVLVMAWGPGNTVDVAAADPGSMLLATAERYLGTAGRVAIEVLLITSLFAALLSFHNVLNRYQRSLAQAGALPKYLERIHERSGAPRRAALVQSIASVALIVVFAILGLDPVVQVFAWLPSIATLSILALMVAVSISVLMFFRARTEEVGVWKRVVAPTLSLVALIGMIVFVAINFPLLAGELDQSGSPAYGPVSFTLVGIIVLAAVGGAVRALVLKNRHPEKYAALAATLHD